MAKIGEGSGSAFVRQGMREIRAALYPESNVAQTAEYGTYLTKTPGEIAEDRRGDGRDPEDEMSQGSVLGERLRQAESRADRDERGRDMERG